MVEGVPIKRPRLPPQRTFVIHAPPLTTQLPSEQSPSEEAERTTQPSCHRPSAVPARHPSGKENQSDGVKQRQPSSASLKRESDVRTVDHQNISTASRSCRRLAREQSLVEPQKRARRLGLSLSGGGALLVPRTYSLIPPCGMLNYKPQPSLVLGPQMSRRFLPQTALEPQRKALPRGLPSLSSSLPAVEGVRLHPSTLTGALDSRCASFSFHPSLRRHQILPHFHRQTMTKYQGGGTGEHKHW